MDAGFYRGTSTEQDIRFTDKERKLLKQMKFEDVLEQKVDLQKVNIDVLKPWITLKLNEILGMEDDVVVEYVFTQLEEKELNPKKMQINLTGFLNARRAREFMGELWQMFVEAQNSPQGIPNSLVERKVQELKISNASKQSEQSYAKATEIDWQHRYDTLTGGRYGKVEPRYEAKVEQGGREEGDDERERRKRDPNDDRDERAERRMRHEEQRFKERKDLLAEKQRQDERQTRHHERRRSSSPEPALAPKIRRFTENSGPSSRHDREERDRDEDKERKKRNKKDRKRHHSGGGSESDEGEKRAKKAKKHKKDKKSKKDRARGD